MRPPVELHHSPFAGDVLSGRLHKVSAVLQPASLCSPLSFKFSILLLMTTSAPITLALTNLLATTSTDILVGRGGEGEGYMHRRSEADGRV